MKQKRFVCYIVALLMLTMIAAGCGNGDSNSEADDNGVTGNNEVEVSTSGDVTSYDEAVMAGELNVGDDLVTQTMLINEGIAEEDVVKLAEKIANELKEEYPDKRVNVQAVQDGNNLANILLE